MKSLMVENETSPPKENRNYQSQFPQKDQIYKREGDTEKKSVYQDIFNVDNPKPFSYKPQ